MAERIAALPKAPTAVYASPLERTRETAAPIARALGLRVRTAPGLLELDVGEWTEKPLARLFRDKEWPKVQRWPSGFRFPGGESFAEMSARAMDAVVDLVAAASGRDHRRRLARRHHQGDPGRRGGHPARPDAAARRVALLGLRRPLHRRRPHGAVHQLHRCARRAGRVVTRSAAMSEDFDFDAPDHCTVGVIGEVGNRLFLFYCRQGLTETTVKVEKQQIAVLAGYLGRIVKELGRPGHLPEDLEFYGTEEFEWVVGTIGVSYDEELDRIVIVLEEIGVGRGGRRGRDEDEIDEGGHVLRVALSPRAGGRLRHPCHPARRGGTAAVPPLFVAAGPVGPRLPAHERAPSTGDLTAVSDATVEHVLTEGEMEVHGRIAGSSNATLLVTCRLGADELLAVYKPHKGERPLWDFPGGLFRREVAAYVLSEALGWGLVPETVERPEGPFGRGSVQRFVHEDGTSHYFTLRDDPKWHPALMQIVRLRRRRQQRRPQERPRPAGRGAPLGDRQRPLLQRARQAAHRDLGLRRHRPRAPDVQEDLGRLAHDGPSPALCELLEPAEVAATWDRLSWLLSLRALPEMERRRRLAPLPLAARLSRLVPVHPGHRGFAGLGHDS